MTSAAMSSTPVVDSCEWSTPEKPAPLQHNAHKDPPDVPLPAFLSHDWSAAPLADEMDSPSYAALPWSAPPESASESEPCTGPLPDIIGQESPVASPTPFSGTSGSAWLLSGMKADDCRVYSREDLLTQRPPQQGTRDLWRTLRLPQEAAIIQAKDGERDRGKDGSRMLRGSARRKGRGGNQDGEEAVVPPDRAHYVEAEEILDHEVPSGRRADSSDDGACLFSSGAGSFLAAGGQSAREGWRSRYAAMPKGRGLTGKSARSTWESGGDTFGSQVFNVTAAGIPDVVETKQNKRLGEIDKAGSWCEEREEEEKEEEKKRKKKESADFFDGLVAEPAAQLVAAVPLYIGLNLERHAQYFHEVALDFSERLVREFRVNLLIPDRTGDTTEKTIAAPLGPSSSQLEFKKELREVEASIDVKEDARMKLQSLTEHGGVDLGPITRALEDARTRAHILRELIGIGQLHGVPDDPDIWEYESHTRWIRFSQEKAANLAKAWQSDRGLVVLNAGGENESEVDLVTMQQSIRKNGFVRRVRRGPSHAATDQTSTLPRGSAAATLSEGSTDSAFVWPRALHMTAFYLGGHLGPPGSLLPIGTRRALELEGTEWPVRPTHLIYAEGALLVAALEVAADGLPSDTGSGSPPHATLLTRPPFAPALAGEVLVAARASGLLAPTLEPGTLCATMHVDVGGTQLSLYTARLPFRPAPSSAQGEAALGPPLLDGRLESFWGECSQRKV